MGIGWGEILLILVVALLVFGPNKLPDIARGLGKGIRDFKRAMNGLDDPDTLPRVPVRTARPPAPEKPIERSIRGPGQDKPPVRPT